ncbi:MAG: MarR family transcriptional regulator [Thermoplasmata archaeon]|uniref:MarR family transcriptional regulator n=1 Tax=Candidatus Sysuiplasma superficiale TaxID=2823368 RepID=A0A8J7YW01_9ARCH|nr:MarR family transcriptional regulator [Candidatus Sysuiplasma superficiale]
MADNESALSAWSEFIDAARMLKKEFDRNLSQFGISFIEFKILSLLNEKGPTSMVNIAEELILTKAGVTLLTDRLEERHLLSRTRREGDRRLIYIELTSEGRDILRRAGKSHSLLVERMLSSLSSDDIARLAEITKKIVRVGTPAAVGEEKHL